MLTEAMKNGDLFFLLLLILCKLQTLKQVKHVTYSCNNLLCMFPVMCSHLVSSDIFYDLMIRLCFVVFAEALCQSSSDLLSLH